VKENDNILNAGGDAYKGRSRSPVLSVVFPEDMLKAIRKEAAKRNITAGEMIRRLCDDAIKRGV
jgi:hypothetical protein